ncbi:24301_t:CDS:2, partial [Gigaspora margarita]
MGTWQIKGRIPISNTGTKNLIIESDEYDTESGDTFDEFDYEREAEDVEGQLMKEFKEKIQKFIHNKELTPQQKFEAQEFLLKNKNMFAQSLEDLECTNMITHMINTADMIPINQGPYK